MSSTFVAAFHFPNTTSPDWSASGVPSTVCRAARLIAADRAPAVSLGRYATAARAAASVAVCSSVLASCTRPRSTASDPIRSRAVIMNTEYTSTPARRPRRGPQGLVGRRGRDGFGPSRRGARGPAG
ncbi:MAG TPA: hypothetical protein VF796_10380 [Humisphaera sp.]